MTKETPAEIFCKKIMLNQYQFGFAIKQPTSTKTPITIDENCIIDCDSSDCFVSLRGETYLVGVRSKKDLNLYNKEDAILFTMNAPTI